MQAHDAHCEPTVDAAQPTFMMSSGRIVPIPEIPMPALAVPYAAPMA